MNSWEKSEQEKRETKLCIELNQREAELINLALMEKSSELREKIERGKEVHSSVLHREENNLAMHKISRAIAKKAESRFVSEEEYQKIIRRREKEIEEYLKTKERERLK